MLFCFACFAFIACQKEDDYLSLSIEKLNVAVDGEETSFTLSSNIGWKLSVADSWVKADLQEGTGDMDISLTIDTNHSGADRSTVLTATAGSLVKKIEIAQTTAYLALGADKLVFDAEGTPRELAIKSNYKWSLSRPSDAAWLDFDILSGEGDTVLLLSPTPYTERVLRGESTITFTCFDTEAELTVSQEINNEAPSTPALQAPADASAGVDIPVHFTWKASADADGDSIFYALYLSPDGKTWGEAAAETTDNEAYLTTQSLQEQTTYYWKVKAKDKFGGETESAVYSFTAGENQLYPDGQVLTYQTSSAPGATKPVHLVVLGDGFIDLDYTKGGAFDQAAQTAIEAFFDTEPYPSYRDYFTIYKVAAYSQERGATVKQNFTTSAQRRQTKNTVFSCSFSGGNSTGIDCDYNTVFDYVEKIPAITEAELANTTVLLVINLDVYAGTTIMWSDGKAIAMSPTGESLVEISRHEGGGHAFGKLLDEYIYYPNQSYPRASSQELTEYRQGDVWSFGGNLSLTSDAETIHWKHYFGKEGYEAVGIYEGGDLYGKGVWRPEENSCMNDNTPYFNAPSREAIVRRIMKISGKGFDYDAFYGKDHARQQPLRSSGGTKPPLAPPVLMK